MSPLLGGATERHATTLAKHRNSESGEAPGVGAERVGATKSNRAEWLATPEALRTLSLHSSRCQS
jgi:hypothetical protein